MAQATDDNTTPLRFVDPVELRAKMSKAVERLLAALDALDAVNEDLEEESDDDTVNEPSLGWTLTGNQTARQFYGNGSDLEHEHDGREPDHDNEDDDPAEDEDASEPSLGSFDRMTDQTKSWRSTAEATFVASDCEADVSDKEPSLGSVGSCWNGRDQTQWATGGVYGREPDGDLEPDQRNLPVA